MATTAFTTGTRIRGATALVTGGNRGFGRAMVDELLDRGVARVYATSRTPQESYDRRVIPIVMDVTDDDSVRIAAEIVSDLSIVVNNAGVALRTPVLTAPLIDMQAELDTNLFGVIRVARAFAPLLAENTASSILNVLSVMSWLSIGNGYEISKAAAWSATNALRLALRGRGIIVTALHVSYMDTDMTSRLDVAKADPRDIARQAADAILVGSAEVVADEHSGWVKSQLCRDLSELYPALHITAGTAAVQDDR